MSTAKGRALVAMSGGVDSSATAALLAEQGHEVIGITMQLYDQQRTASGGTGTCCSVDDVFDARRVADRLGIPHYVVNFQEAFGKLVVDDLVSEYLGGRTPNPCVRCNDFMKFRLLLDRALALGADFLATGHYARIDQDPTGRWRLLRAADDHKDQTYFLYPMSQAQLARIRFPLGGLSKPEVRALAARFGLETADKAESQDVCFIAGESYRQFLERSAGDRLPGEGDLVRLDGTRIGRHGGHHRYTVGQRKGLGIASSERLYVVEVDAGSNRVVVGERAALESSGLRASRTRWLAGAPPAPGTPVQAKVRYRSEASPARVTCASAGALELAFDAPISSVTPGQAVVLYDGAEVLGGGVIDGALDRSGALTQHSPQ
jgi:tRNA-specific 2-thiouridylase